MDMITCLCLTNHSTVTWFSGQRGLHAPPGHCGTEKKHVVYPITDPQGVGKFIT